MVPRPNLFVIGAMKSGTTSLDAYIGSHPSIFMAPYKEPTHFVDGRELKRVSPVLWKLGYWRYRDKYLEQFAEAGDAPILGEASTSYSKLPSITGVAHRIADFNPDARIVYIMRDPIERTISHYWHQVKYHGERLKMLKAVRQQPHYREVSHYAMQLAPFLEVFGPKQVKTLTLEAMRDDAVEVVQDLFRWLGIDPTHVPPRLQHRNVTVPEINGADPSSIMRKLRRWRHWDRVGPMIPTPIRSVGRWLAEQDWDRGVVGVDRVVEYLRPLQQAETRELIELLGREFPEWKTLSGAGPGRSCT